MTPMGRILGKLAEPALRVWVGVVLLSLLLSLAACGGEQGPPAGDSPPPTATSTANQLPAEQPIPAAIPT